MVHILSPLWIKDSSGPPAASRTIFTFLSSHPHGLHLLQGPHGPAKLNYSRFLFPLRVVTPPWPLLLLFPHVSVCPASPSQARCLALLPSLVSFKPHPKLKICFLFVCFCLLKSWSGLHIRWRFYGYHRPNQDLGSNQLTSSLKGVNILSHIIWIIPMTTVRSLFWKAYVFNSLPVAKNLQSCLDKVCFERSQVGMLMGETFDISPQVFQLVLLFYNILLS